MLQNEWLQPYSCDQCDFKTNHKNSLNTHRSRLHGNNLTRKHMCELCGKAFFTKVIHGLNIRRLTKLGKIFKIGVHEK